MDVVVGKTTKRFYPSNGRSNERTNERSNERTDEQGRQQKGKKDDPSFFHFYPSNERKRKNVTY